MSLRKPLSSESTTPTLPSTPAARLDRVLKVGALAAKAESDARARVSPVVKAVLSSDYDDALADFEALSIGANPGENGTTHEQRQFALHMKVRKAIQKEQREALLRERRLEEQKAVDAKQLDTRISDYTLAQHERYNSGYGAITTRLATEEELDYDPRKTQVKTFIPAFIYKVCEKSRIEGDDPFTKEKEFKWAAYMPTGWEPEPGIYASLYRGLYNDSAFTFLNSSAHPTVRFVNGPLSSNGLYESKDKLKADLGWEDMDRVRKHFDSIKVKAKQLFSPHNKRIGFIAKKLPSYPRNQIGTRYDAVTPIVFCNPSHDNDTNGWVAYRLEYNVGPDPFTWEKVYSTPRIPYVKFYGSYEECRNAYDAIQSIFLYFYP